MRRKQGQSKTLSSSELNRVMKYQDMETHGFRNKSCLMFSFGMGMRVSEIASLSVQDVLNQDGSLKDVITLRKENTKGNKTRQIPFVHKKVISVLKEYLEFRKENNDNEPLDMQSPLFVSQRNGRFSRQTMSELFKVMFRKVGLSEECSSHSGRRTWISNLIADGYDMKSVSHLAGHSSIRTTIDVYAKTNPQNLSNICKNVRI